MSQVAMCLILVETSGSESQTETRPFHMGPESHLSCSNYLSLSLSLEVLIDIQYFISAPSMTTARYTLAIVWC